MKVVSLSALEGSLGELAFRAAVVRGAQTLQILDRRDGAWDRCTTQDILQTSEPLSQVILSAAENHQAAWGAYCPLVVIDYA